MSEEIKKKYGDNSIGEFWTFIEKLNYNSQTTDADSVKQKLLKTIAPHQAEKYRAIAEIYAKSLAGRIVSPNSTAFVTILPAAYLAVEKGKETYNISLEKNTLPLSGLEIDQVSVINCLINVFPREDDYYNSFATEVEDDLEY